MSDVVGDDDGLLRSLDAFVETVYWLEEPVEIEHALAEAIEDWVAMVAAERNGSELWGTSVSTDTIGIALLQLVEAVEHTDARGGQTISVASAIAEALSDWCRRAAE